MRDDLEPKATLVVNTTTVSPNHSGGAMPTHNLKASIKRISVTKMGGTTCVTEPMRPRCTARGMANHLCVLAQARQLENYRRGTDGLTPTMPQRMLHPSCRRWRTPVPDGRRGAPTPPQGSQQLHHRRPRQPVTQAFGIQDSTITPPGSNLVDLDPIKLQNVRASKAIEVSPKTTENRRIMQSIGSAMTVCGQLLPPLCRSRAEQGTLNGRPAAARGRVGLCSCVARKTSRNE